MKESMRFEAPSTPPVGHFRPCSSNRESRYGVETTKSRRSMWITLISFLAVLAMRNTRSILLSADRRTMR